MLRVVSFPTVPFPSDFFAQGLICPLKFFTHINCRLVLLMAYFGLGSVHSVLIITQAVNDWAMRAEVKYYQFELVLSMIGVTRILGIMTCEWFSSSYSEIPCLKLQSN